MQDDRCGYDWAMPAAAATDARTGRPDNARRGHPFNYFTQGAALAEVELDALTGDHSVLRVDLLVDIGASINPAIDVGQIEGAFAQGLGWCTLEDVAWADPSATSHGHQWAKPAGRLITQGPGAYKIPSFNDAPRELNVRLLPGVPSRFAVHSSKAVGEPPFFLAAAVLFALRAPRARRDELLVPRIAAAAGDDDAARAAARRARAPRLALHSPATSERLRMACADAFVARVVDGDALPPPPQKGAERVGRAAHFQARASV